MCSKCLFKLCPEGQPPSHQSLACQRIKTKECSVLTLTCTRIAMTASGEGKTAATVAASFLTVSGKTNHYTLTHTCFQCLWSFDTSKLILRKLHMWGNYITIFCSKVQTEGLHHWYNLTAKSALQYLRWELSNLSQSSSLWISSVSGHKMPIKHLSDKLKIVTKECSPTHSEERHGSLWVAS
jgi:hypothetical protein